jgi:hypothetical protein
MTTKQLLKYHEQFSKRARHIVKIKNHDYSGASGDTPFANFEVSEKLRITSTEKGFLVRIVDKVMRLSTFAESGTLTVKTESVEDACLDISNYCILLSAYIKQKNNKQ